MRKMIGLLPASLACLIFSCGPVSDLGVPQETDMYPPRFRGITATSRTEIRIEFDEPAFLQSDSLSISPALSVRDVTRDADAVSINTEAMTAGQEYTVEAVAVDGESNSLSFAAVFYGFNPAKPLIKINEFTTQGSKTHPDLVELKILSNGDMAGLTFYQGVAENWTNRFVFPKMPVKKGDFILLHFKPEHIPAEINEIQNKTQSGGLDASPLAFDFWVSDGKGLSGNNGVLSLYDQPRGIIIDGVLYSNRTSDSDEAYAGFGSNKTKIKAYTLFSAGAWAASSGDIRPQDGINPDNSTATRSMCRTGECTDTDSKNDWHIVPTGKSSFGEENCEEQYRP